MGTGCPLPSALPSSLQAQRWLGNTVLIFWSVKYITGIELMHYRGEFSIWMKAKRVSILTAFYGEALFKPRD